MEPEKIKEQKDWSLRHRILGIPDPNDSTEETDADNELWSGGIERFENLSVGAVGTLIELGFLDPKDRQNAAPTAGRFYEFMKRYPIFMAHGYAVHPRRSDVRVTIEGIACQETLETDVLAEFRKFARGADELTIEPGIASCWWD